MKFSKLEHWDRSKGYRKILQKTLSTQGRLKLRTQQVISIFLKLKCGNELKKNVAANFADFTKLILDFFQQVYYGVRKCLIEIWLVKDMSNEGLLS